MVFLQLRSKSKLQQAAARKKRSGKGGLHVEHDGALRGFGRSTSGWAGAWRALSCAGLSFGDCVAAPAGLNGG